MVHAFHRDDATFAIITAQELPGGGTPFAFTGGTGDAITATFTPTILPLFDGMMVRIRASAANTIAAPTFNPDGSGALTIHAYGGASLKPGDIIGINHDLYLTYNAGSTRWELGNPGGIFLEGTIHGRGLVPDPGSTAGTTRFLREDATWQSPSAGGTGIVCVPSTGNTATDTTNIQNALNAGGLVVLTSAAYTLTAITIPGGSWLMGMGPYGTVLTPSGNPAAFITLSGSGAQATEFGITGTCGNAIQIHGTTVTEARIARLNIDSSFTITNGVLINGVTGGFYNVVEDCRINNCSNAGVNLAGSNSLACRLFNLDIGGNGTTTNGVLASLGGLNGAGFTMDQVSVEQCINGFNITNASYFAANCTADSCTHWGWLTNYNSTTFQPGAGWSAQLNGCQGGGTSSNPGGSPQPGRGMGFFTTGASVLSTVNLTGCLFENNATDGLGVTAGAGTTAIVNVVGCNAFNNGLAASGGSGHGMYFNSLLVNVVGNMSGRNALAGSTGIFIDTACTGRVGDNSGTGNSSGVCVTNASVNTNYNDFTGIVANLPAASAGSRAYVTNATVTTFSTVVAGGGANVVPVYADGTNWRIG